MRNFPVRPILKSAIAKLTTATASGILLLCTSSTTRAAERFSFRYGPLGGSLPISSLEAFAVDGTIDSHIDGYLRYLDAETLVQVRDALSSPYLVDPVVFSQMLYTPMGEQLLQSTGLTIQTGAGLNGRFALRSALIEAAAHPKGLSLIEILRSFPTREINLNLNRVLTVKRDVERSVRQTSDLIDFVKQQSAKDAAANPFDYTSLPDLRARGPYAVQFIPLNLQDETRDRALPADLFLPDMPEAGDRGIPILIVSHGLGHSRIYFRNLAEHIASYGFAVAMPEHIGSNEGQKQAMESWLAREFFQRREFIDRPRDISFLLDELTHLNPTVFAGQLDVNRVGAVGHSFGGYTVLATAGATLDFEELRQHCDREVVFASNLSQFLQCRALELESSPEDVELLTGGGLRDERIQLVMAFNPVSRLFGKTGASRIKIPTLIAGGAHDFVTPVMPEQADIFRRLTTPEKYFLLTDRASHTNEITRGILQFFSTLDDEAEIEAAIRWLDSNYAALLVAWARVYLADRESDRPYLESAYVESIGIEPFSLHLVRALPESN